MAGRRAQVLGGGAKGHCFVVMPFSRSSRRHTEAYWTRFFEHFIRPAVEGVGLSCERSNAGPSDIIQHVIKQLVDSDIVLAVLTDSNKNVWYELGFRHALRGGTIMMIEQGQDIPFDLRPYGCIYYHDNADGRDAFRQELSAFLPRL
jgi:hypothetical protein